MNKCIECQHIRGSQTMQKHGFGHCTKLDKNHYVSASFVRVCKDFTQADEETIAARLAKVAV